MVKFAASAALVAALLLPQAVDAAGRGYYPRHHVRVRLHRYAVMPNRVITCTSGNYFLFTAADCGQGFDPLSLSGL